MKVAVFGDSVAAGLGVRGRSFAALVAEQLDGELVDLAVTSQQITEALGKADDAGGCDIVLLAQGGAEAVIRPTPGALRFVPKRYRRHGWLDPRPFYSSKRGKRIWQRIESNVRWRVKVLLIKLSGGYRLCEPDEYEVALREMIARLQDSGCGTVVVMSHTGIDDRYFPGTNASLMQYYEVEQRVADETGCMFIDVRDTCPKWDGYFLDHVHPNVAGHRAFADHLLRELAVRETAEAA